MISSLIPVLLVSALGAAAPSPSTSVPLELQEPFSFTFAVYHPSKPDVDPVGLAEKFLAAKFKDLAVVRASPPRAPGVRISSATPKDFSNPTELDVQVAHGLSEAEKVAVTRSVGATVFRFFTTRETALPTNRAAQALALHVAERTAGLLWDDASQELYSTKEWRRRRIDAWSEAAPSLQHHIVVRTGPEERAHSTLTVGMRKFGLPDLELRKHSAANVRLAVAVLNLVAQALVEQVKVGPGARLSLARGSVQDPASRAVLELIEKSEGPMPFVVELRASPTPSPSTGGPLVELLPPPGPDTDKNHDTWLLQLAPSEGSGVHRSAAEIESRCAGDRKRLPAMLARFKKGLAPGEVLLVKAPFRRGEYSEWMWLEVRALEGDSLVGRLNSTPVHLKELRPGAEVKVPVASVCNLELYKADGSTEGNEAGRESRTGPRK
jgi:hypothetical protein